MLGQKFTVTNDDGHDMSLELLNFSKFIGLNNLAPNRYSILLVLQLFGALKSGMLNPAKIIYEIKVLEGKESSSNLKAGGCFKNLPLKGLWHQHYMEDGMRALVRNVERGLKKYDMPFVKRKIREAKEAGECHDMTIEDCALIANDVVQNNFLRLANSKQLTGEWIIYAKYNGENYYLCLGNHGEDEIIRKQINTICHQEFPFLI